MEKLKINLTFECFDIRKWMISGIIKKCINETLAAENVSVGCEINVLVTDNSGIHAINLASRNIDAPTDVLSFPILEFDEDGVMIEESGDYDGDLLLLGDIVISLERALKQAEEYGHSLEREVGFLTVHSTLHLLGFDHMEEPFTTVMRAREKEIMEKMNLKR